MATGLRIFNERTNEGVGSPILSTNDGEVLMHTQDGISIVLGPRAAESPGTLYITSKQVIWLSDVDVSKGYAVDFISISLHAISRDPEGYPSPCIYTQAVKKLLRNMMLNLEYTKIETGEDEDEDEEEDEAELQMGHWSSGISKIKEMRLVPSDPSQLETLFNVLCECAELNPEPVAGQDEEEHNWIFSADQLDVDAFGNDEDYAVPIGQSNGDHSLAHNVLQLHINDQRFEDADEMEDDTNNEPH